ncbi:glycosyltransferase [Pseudonocardia sp. MH-G8]|nr:glycosyltransferase [Pseudonocardia sp. MH-G8]
MFVVPDLGTGGAERHVVTLAPALDPARFTVSVVCIGDEGALFTTLTRQGVPGRALHSRYRRLRALLGLIRIMRRERPDVVITRGYNADTLGRIAAALTRVPRSVVWVHNSSDITPRSPVRRVVYRLLDAVTSAYYGVAEVQRGYLVDQLGFPESKIEVIENGVDPARFRPPPPGERARVARELGISPTGPTIGILAVLRPEKDHSTALHAMRTVLDEIPDARLVLIGDGPARGALEQLAEELGIARSVVFAGARSDVAPLLAVVDVVLLSSYTECFPLAVLEAMACGLPVVGTDVGGVPEMIDDGTTGRLVPPRDPRAMAEALIKLLRDPEPAAEMGRAARRRVEERFTLERSVRVAESTLLRTAGREHPARPLRLSIVQDEVTVGGAENLLLDLCRHIDRSVVEPRLVCLREAGAMRSDFEAAGVVVESLGRRGRFDPSTLVRLVRSFRAAGTDVVLVTHYHRAALLLGRIAARFARVPANVVAAHDMDLRSVGKRVLPRTVVETLFLSHALVLLAPSQGRYLHDEEGVGRFPWRRIREVVIPNGVEVPPAPAPADRTAARERLGLDPADFVVGIVAVLRPQKAHHVLLRAIASLTPAHPRLRLVVVGDGPEEGAVRALVDHLGIADRVLFTGLRSDVAQLLPGFDVSCLSSVHEGAPLAVLESMAAGVPVVATDCGAVRDMVADSREGFIVPVGDAVALAGRLAELIADPDLRQTMGLRARARAERECSIERTVQGFQQLLVDLVPR